MNSRKAGEITAAIAISGIGGYVANFLIMRPRYHTSTMMSVLALCLFMIWTVFPLIKPEILQPMSRRFIWLLVLPIILWASTSFNRRGIWGALFILLLIIVLWGRTVGRARKVSDGKLP